MKSALTATPWLTGFTAGNTTSGPVPATPGEFRDGWQYGLASRLGDLHGAELIRPFDAPDGGLDMDQLLTVLGESGPADPETADHHIALVNAYSTAYDIRSRKD